MRSDAHERRVEWNATERPYPRECSVHELFEAQVERAPDSVAVVHGERSLTYAQLDARANRLAHLLVERGVGPRTRVALLMPRSMELVVAELAILKAGAAYVPLDPTFPVARIAFVVADVGSRLVLSLSGQEIPHLPCVERIDVDAITGGSAESPGVPLESEAAAYVMYTSGSTGEPKGVVVPHRAIGRLVLNNGYAAFGPEDRVAFAANPAFDATTMEVWAPLLNGGRIVVIDQDVLLDPIRFGETLKGDGVSVLWLTVGLFNRYADDLKDVWPRLRYLIVGGDALDPGTIARVLRRGAPEHLLNGYGPTETTTFAITHEVESVAEGAASIPLGRPISNTRVYVLDRAGEPVPVGVDGELYIGGAGLSHGYLNRPALTAERFVPDVFSAEPGARLYRTGDLGRWSADGYVEFLGRNDGQVKVRGFRIELGEIEARLSEHPGVREAVVLAREEVPGDKRLVGYVVPDWERVDAAAAGTDGWEAQHQADWQATYDQTYGEDAPAPAPDPTFNIVGWNSSFTGEPLPAEEMREWVDETVARIRTLAPRRVLEIGCGTGLLLARVAPDCERYVGVDFSAVALRGIDRMRREVPGLAHVELLERRADELGHFEPGSFDTVVINSVVQYFPDVEYLARVLEGAVRLLAPGGRMFVGDVRSLPLLDAFHTAVETFRSPAERPVTEWRDAAEQSHQREDELVVDPAFFRSLGRELSAVGHVEVLQKRGRFRNELTDFRYDVVLHVGEAPAGAAGARWIDWESERLDLPALRARLADMAEPALVVGGIPNARVTAALRQAELRRRPEGAEVVGDVRRMAAEHGVDPHELWDLGEASGWSVEVSLADSDDPGRMDVLFTRIAPAQGRPGFPVRTTWARREMRAYTTDPLRGKRRAALVSHLRRHLADRLPEYMVPSAYVCLEALPLTPNGKVDRRALPAPDGGSAAHAARGYEAPAGEVEVALAQIWADVLGVERLGRRDHFFELGGHSLRAVQVISRVRQVLAVEVAPRELFLRPVLADFARGLETAARTALPPIRPTERGEHLPLSFAQQRLWFLEQLGGVGTAYHIPARLRLRGELDRTALSAALDRIVVRHEALRTVFVQAGGEPVQRVAPASESAFHLVQHDLGEHPGAEAELCRLTAEEAGAPFDLERGPLIRGRLVRLAGDDHVLLLTMHHIVSDGWSMGVLARELDALYSAFLRGEPDPLPELPVQYGDYAVWQRRWMEGEVLQRQADYWRGALTGAPELLELPTDHARPARQDHAGGAVGLELDEALTAALKALGRRNGTTLFMTLLAGWATVLSRLSRQEDVVVGTPTANRGRTEIEGLIGFFVNTLVMRVDLSGGPTVAELLGRVKAGALAAQEHQDIPFERVVELLQPVRSLAHSPLFQVFFAWQNAPGGRLELPRLKPGVLETTAHDMAKFDLSLSLRESGGRIVGSATYATALFERRTVERYLGYLERVLRQMVADNGRAVGEMELLEEAERRQVVEEWNATRAEYPADLCIHELVEAQVERTPDMVAVACEDEQLTYAELNRRANRLAHHLRARGVGPDVLVGICMERSVAMVTGLLGVLKAGGAYVPLDPTYPEERLRLMCEDSAPAVVLTQESLVGGLAGFFRGTGVPVLDLDAVAPVWASEPATNPGRAVLAPDHLAYVIYTSGSTGRPKGVLNTHRNVVNRITWGQHAWKLETGEVMLGHTSLSFDGSIRELVWPLTVGAQVVLAGAGPTDPGSLVATLRRARVSTLNLVPALLQALVDTPEVTHCTDLRRVLCGGDVLPEALRQRVSERLPWAAVHNLYGPSEAATAATVEACAPEDGVHVPIGRPIGNTRVYVLGASGDPVPTGVAGEMCIGGAGVARGYLGRPALTAERFTPDPFGGEPGGRLYRTGDLGRWRSDGRLEFVGRSDHQVKVRGFRIELGEIEARLEEHAGVREGVVAAREDALGDVRLVAYWVGREAVEIESLRAHLSERLPEYMVPAAYVRLEALPLTPNGKVDRRALPAPGGGAYVSRPYQAPVGETEVALAEIWSGVLGVERVGRWDHFFELGGHSLLAVLVVSRLRKALEVEVAVGDVFVRPVLGDFARALETARRAELPPLEKSAREEHLPLSFAQQRLWFLTRLGDAGSGYHIPKRVRLRGELDRSALRRALDRIVARHEALRTRFHVVDGGPEQRIRPEEESGFELREHDLSDRTEAELDRVMAEEAEAPFDLERGPLFRGHLIRLAPDDHVLLLTMHHIVSDGWSVGVLFNELSVLYGAFTGGEPDPLPMLPIQYADYAAWQRRYMEGDVLQQQGDYWKKTLAGAPGLLELPTDRARPAEQDFAGAAVRLELDEELTAGLKALSRRQGTTLFMTLLAGWATVLGRLSGQQDMVVGTPTANRGRTEVEGLIGLFVNMLALRLDLTGSPTVAELLGRVKARVLEAQHHQDIPFEQVVERVQPERSLSHSPLFQVVFAWQNTPEGDLALPGVEVGDVGSPESHVTARFDLALSLSQAGLRIVGEVSYATALFGRETVERYMGYLRRVLEQMAADGGRRVDRLALVPEAELRQVVEEWNATDAAYPNESCVHQLFEAQVERTPRATAVVCEGERTSYEELNRLANRLASHLMERGVGPDVRVALCVERSLALMVGLLGVLKAGGAYVPLDPSYPAERLRYMLKDSAAVTLLTQCSLDGLFAGAEVPVLALDAVAPEWEGQPQTNPRPAGLTPDSLAYVIYTSGSTGEPKGVMCHHRGVVNQLAWSQETWGLGAGEAVLQKIPFSFDVSVRELFWPLTVGARVVLARPEGHRDPAYLIETIRRERVGATHFPPSALGDFLSHPEVAECSTLTRVLTGGESLSPALIERFYERLPSSTLYHMYGPTEATVAATGQSCPPESIESSRRIGRPTANTRIFIMDEACELLPVGVAGELYVGGAQVARGYVGRAALTAERFVPDPFSGEPGGRLYRTGDLGRWLPGGTIEFLGRNDQQVKVRGYRIELGEIEARLAEHAGVREAVVAAREDAPGDARLVAYWVGEDGVEAETLRAHLTERLPEHMVPAAYLRLEALPLLPNGKVDRRALPAPGSDAYATRGYEAPVGETETALAEIWAEVLGIERVGRHDHFFELGGHSLLATKLVVRIREHTGTDIALKDIFETPVLSGLAARVIQRQLAQFDPEELAALLHSSAALS